MIEANDMEKNQQALCIVYETLINPLLRAKLIRHGERSVAFERICRIVAYSELKLIKNSLL